MNLIIKFCQIRQMQHQTEKCLVPEASEPFIHTADCHCVFEIHDKFYILDAEDTLETPC